MSDVGVRDTQGFFIDRCKKLLSVIEDHESKRLLLKESVEINRESIDEDFLRHPVLTMEVSEYLTEVAYLRNRMKADVAQIEIMSRKKAAKHRFEGKPTRDMIADFVNEDKFVLAGRILLARADRFVQGWDSLKAAYSEKGSALRHLSGLLTNGHFPSVGVGSAVGDRRGSR